ncbi:MAG TPA: hypothetical protein VGM56_16510 [Byssovorax sp.]|jgi:hypothetical protein
MKKQWLCGVAAVALATAGCGGKDAGTAGSGSAAPAATSAAPAAPPPAATPAGGSSATAVTPKAMPPFESLKFTIRSEKADSGWPKFDAVNAGDKPVTFAAIYGFAYSKDGKLVKRLSTPLSWNIDLAPGAKADFPVSVGSFEKDKITADVFELCYNSITFKGDAKGTEDQTLCTDKRPMGGDKNAGAAASAGADASSAPADAKGAKGGKAGGGGKKKGKH